MWCLRALWYLCGTRLPTMATQYMEQKGSEQFTAGVRRYFPVEQRIPFISGISITDGLRSFCQGRECGATIHSPTPMRGSGFAVHNFKWRGE